MRTTPTMCAARMATNRWVAVVEHQPALFCGPERITERLEPGEHPFERSGTITTLF